jgi:TRAP-type C4-dicarboxylate transport system permease small subunit
MTEGAAAPPARGIGATVDDFVYAVEKGLITLACLVMTATVTLDIVYRSFSAEESQLAVKLGSLIGGTEETVAFLAAYVTPAILALLTFFAGYGVRFSSLRIKGHAHDVKSCALWGAGTLIVGYAFIQFVLHVPSRWVCMTLLVAGCLAFAVRSARRGDWVAFGLALVAAAAGGYACTLLRQGYIWSQELSLILLAWVAFIGGSMATREGRHIVVDALGKIVPKSGRPWTRALGLLATTAFCGYMTLLAYHHVFGEFGDIASGERRPSTGIPAWTITLSFVVAFALMTARFAAQTLDAFRNPRIPEERLTH